MTFINCVESVVRVKMMLMIRMTVSVDDPQHVSHCIDMADSGAGSSKVRKLTHLHLSLNGNLKRVVRETQDRTDRTVTYHY